MAKPHSSPTQPGAIRAVLVDAAVVAMAVALLQWNGIAAFTVPSASMQPTLLGSDLADVHDRVLVDPMRYALVDPARWDLVAFAPPLNRREHWLKRCIGLPGERIALAGGNVHRIVRRDDHDRYELLHRPPGLLASMWREVHPARARARDDATHPGTSFAATPLSAWRESGAGMSVQLTSHEAATLRWDDPDGGLVDRPWDGCPDEVARALRAAPSNQNLGGAIVPDARIAVRLAPTRSMTRTAVTLTVLRPQLPTRHFALEWQAGEIRLVVRGSADGPVLAQSPSAPLPPDAGDRIDLEFAHIDDALVATVGGREALRLDVAAFDTNDGCDLPDPCGAGPAMPTAAQQVVVELHFEGAGTLEVADLRIWRDQHWRNGQADAPTEFEVPLGHYFVLGDNPAESTDSRGFQAIELDVVDDRVVLTGQPGSRRLRGASMLVADDLPPRRDENPVALAGRGAIAFTDEYGAVHALRAPIAVDAATHLPRLSWPGLGPDDDGSFPGTPVHFVPREHVLGRAVLRCWPLPPFGPWRPGLLR